MINILPLKSQTDLSINNNFITITTVVFVNLHHSKLSDISLYTLRTQRPFKSALKLSLAISHIKVELTTFIRLMEAIRYTDDNKTQSHHNHHGHHHRI